MDNPRILIVEDDPDVSEMLTAFFRASQYEVVTAAWGEEGLRAAHQDTFSLIMLDIRLPDISGYDVCRQLRLDRRTATVPILFLTEKRDRVDKLQGLELGVVDYITKPFDIQELRLRVRNAIQRASQQTLLNPITELPDTQLVEERLAGLISAERPWTVLLFTLVGMERLREVYGFVAADEMLRAVTMIMRGACRAFGDDSDYIGHFTADQFVILTQPERAAEIRRRAEVRIGYSLETFDRLKEGDSSALRLIVGMVTSDEGPFDSYEALRDHLIASISAAS